MTIGVYDSGLGGLTVLAAATPIEISTDVPGNWQLLSKLRV